MSGYQSTLTSPYWDPEQSEIYDYHPEVDECKTE